MLSPKFECKSRFQSTVYTNINIFIYSVYTNMHIPHIFIGHTNKQYTYAISVAIYQTTLEIESCVVYDFSILVG